jgi:Protein of unknown function, DUF547
MKQRLLFWMLIGVTGFLAGCSTWVKTPEVPVPSAAVAQSAWARVLDRFVTPRGEVQFRALARDRADLDLMVRYVAATPLATFTDPDHKLAHMINAYNALSMFNVIDSGIPASHAGWAKLRFFVLRKHTIGGEVLSLYAFENDVIRPFTRQRNDPRVHFALNCSAVSCPVLPREPFVAARLEAQLARETTAFFARPENLRVDHAERTVWLNEILRFYTEDFVPGLGKNLLEAVSRYLPTPLPTDYTVRFAPYDWTIANAQR